MNLIREGMDVTVGDKKGKVVEVLTIIKVEFDDGGDGLFSPNRVRMCDVGGLIY